MRNSRPKRVVALSRGVFRPSESGNEAKHVIAASNVICMLGWLIRRLEKQWLLECGQPNGRPALQEAGAAGLDLSNKHFRTHSSKN
jgi:hypothetical protein